MEAPEDGPEELPHEEMEAPAPMPAKKAGGKKEVENPARFMSKISLLTGALQEGADRKEIDKLIGEAPKEYKRLKDRKSDVAQKYREDLKTFHAEVDNYVDAQEEKTSTCRKLEKLKRELKTPDETEEGSPENEPAKTRLGRLAQGIDNKVSGVFGTILNPAALFRKRDTKNTKNAV